MKSLASVLPLLLLAACLSRVNEPSPPVPTPKQPTKADGPSEPTSPAPAPAPAPMEAQPDLAQPLDMSRPPADLTGLQDCYGYAACDPAVMMCIKFLLGTAANPGLPRATPACYEPTEPCANGVLDCNCIQNDAVLRVQCGNCVDNQDRTFTCYES